MKVILLVVLMTAIFCKESVALESEKKRRGDETNRKIVDFLSQKKDKMEMFLNDMVSQSSINDKEKRLLQEIKDYVVLLG